MSKWPIFNNFALKFQALKNCPRKVKILVQVAAIQISSWVKVPSLQDEWFGQGDTQSEGLLQTFQALFFRPAAFDPYIDMIECTGNNDKNIYWPPMSRGHYRECMARTYVGTFSLCRCQKEYYETSFSSHTLLVTGPPPTHSKRKKSVQQNCVI